MALSIGGDGTPFAAHVSLPAAGDLARAGRTAGAGATTFVDPAAPFARVAPPRAATTSPSLSGKRTSTPIPHTAVTSGGGADPDQWDGMLNRLGRTYNVPPLFLKAVMLAESGGQPDAVGDQGHSVGLFQLHDQGYGAGMGDARFDPETNADRAARGLGEAWRSVERRGLTGEEAIRAAYDYSFNPGGGWAYQGDSVVRQYNRLAGGGAGA